MSEVIRFLLLCAGAMALYGGRLLYAGQALGVARHRTMMLAASIATITAFLVVNVEFHPGYVVWLSPTVAITPLIVVLNRRLQRGDAMSRIDT